MYRHIVHFQKKPTCHFRLTVLYCDVNVNVNVNDRVGKLECLQQGVDYRIVYIPVCQIKERIK